MTNQRFEVGGRVVVVETLADELRGQEGKVVSITRSPRLYRILLDNKRDLYFLGSQLDHQKGDFCVSNTE